LREDADDHGDGSYDVIVASDDDDVIVTQDGSDLGDDVSACEVVIAEPGSTPAHGAFAAPATCFGSAATIEGTTGNDHLDGTDNDDTIAALAGQDIVDGVVGSDLLCGGRGRDQVSGGDGNDRLKGGPGVDQLSGEHGDDFLDARDGNAKGDYVGGGAGFDTCYLSAGDAESACEVIKVFQS
jgi:Ca2+-binding RTX toxin-like protein